MSSEHLFEESKNLFSALDAEFEKPFRPEGYSSEISLPMSNDSLGAMDDYFRLMADGLRLQSGRDWNVLLKPMPNPSSELSLGLSALMVPVWRNKTLGFHAINSGAYVPILYSPGDRQEVLNLPMIHLDKEIGAQHAPNKHRGFLAVLLQKARISEVTDMPSSPNKAREHLARIFTSKDIFTISEDRTIPCDPGQTIGLQRRTVVQTSHKFTFLDASIDFVNPNDINNINRLKIEFGGDDYQIEVPKIYRQKLKLESAPPGLEAEQEYKEVSSEPLDVTPGLLGNITASIIEDQLGGIDRTNRIEQEFRNIVRRFNLD